MKSLHPRLEVMLTISGALAEVAALAARSTQRQILRSSRPRRGQTLRPGIDTPLWNALTQVIRNQLTHYGDKARLARYLGLPRQRMHDFLRGRHALPDAERTLMLLCWLAAKREGRDLTGKSVT